MTYRYNWDLVKTLLIDSDYIFWNSGFFIKQEETVRDSNS